MAADILSLTADTDGAFVTVEADFGATGGTYDTGDGGNALSTTSDWETNAAFQGTVTRPGYTILGTPTTYTDSIFGTKIARQAYPNNASLDEALNGSSKLEFKIWLDMPIFGADTNASANVAAALVTVSGTPSNAASSMSITGATRAYPRPIMRCASVPWQRVTGSFTVRYAVDHYFAQNAAPVACVKITASDTDDGGSTSQTKIAIYAPHQWEGSGLYTPLYSATFDAADFTQGARIKVTAEAFPWRGDVTTNSATHEDCKVEDPLTYGINEFLGPVYYLCDKNDTLACYASIDSVSGDNGTGAVSGTKAGARAAPYATLAAAITALKTYNNSTNSDNSLNNCVVLVQNGTYTGPGTFTGSNDKTFYIVEADTENGATEAGCQFTTATNQAHNAYLCMRNVTLEASGVGMLRGNVSTGMLWLDSCTINLTNGTTNMYAWAAVYGTDNSITAFVGGWGFFSTYRSPALLVAGNARTTTGVIDTLGYCVLGNIRHNGNTYKVTNAGSSALPDNAILGWNEAVGLSSGNAYCLEILRTAITWQSGTAQAGAATTITLDAGASATNDYYNGLIISITGGTGSGQTRLIRDYVGSTKVATVHRAWDTNPDATSTFDISRDGQMSFGLSYNNIVAERWGSDTQPMMQVAADSCNMSTTHVLLSHLTVTGARVNSQYNDSQNPSATLWRRRFIVADSVTGLNIKSDVFGTDGTLVNNWEGENGVGDLGNLATADLGFTPDFAGRYSNNGSASVSWTDDQSYNTGGSGGGDYHGTGDMENLVPAGAAVCLCDLYGTPYRNDGTDSAGAINVTATTPLGTLADAFTWTNPDGQTVDAALTLAESGGFDLSWSPIRNGSLGVKPLRGYPL